MKKILLGLGLVISFVMSQQIGQYGLDCESVQSSNYTIYINGFGPIGGNNSMSFTGKVKQDQNSITIVAKENITNIFLELEDDNIDKTVTNWNIALTNGVARTLVVKGLNNYGFNNAWETADSLTTLSTSDIRSISNIANKWVDILENEKFGSDFGKFYSNEYKHGTMRNMKWQDNTFDGAIESSRYIFTNSYMGANRSSFTKNIDYEITISPYNNKIVNVKSKSKLYLMYIGSNDSEPNFNWDYRVRYFNFFKKDGKWWIGY